ncbi:ATP-binding protein [Streptomyces sp. NPDC041068]|uniref:sensor histidine kinase n=1 Tax=Streptomyces sp. NPDC041068 TaxID=3155130 RepID=UPI0033E1475B
MKNQRILAATSPARDHELANYLHTLAGLLDLEMYALARQFVAELSGDLARVRQRAPRSEPPRERPSEPLLHALLAGKRAAAAERGVTLRLADKPPPSRPAVDPRDLVTVLGNLIDNAVEAAAEHPAAEHPAAKPFAEVGMWSEADATVLSVADNGPGVPAALRDAVFLDGWSTKEAPSHRGRGVGLTLVDGVARRYGGSVRLAERPGGGAVFTVRLPRDPSMTAGVAL